ncbi:LacI family DNA-binding transcriptional regulator [Alteribacter natronophilus]|uniref:LacI family DNA-binding transcriptional regulator n=1 Tax=Alteribacter natronophilus TaxID=2583810 RepID=UPI00110D92E1|nr:LacI family DNA-binding transcriptional regulator [Alteribacter natronophilus]TMW70145.1 LacI family transcriptional regulator [Alteribacter natronophilus]
MVTIRDIASLAGVSRTTVSRVLNGSGYVSEQARKRVMEVIEETGYVPSEQAKALRTKKSNVIGVILPKISTETASRVADGIDTVLNREGYQMILANAKLKVEKEIEQLKLLESRRVDGIILLATNKEDRLLKAIESLSVPVVALGQDLPSISSVIYDDYHAAREMTEAILKKGRNRIGFIGVYESDHAVGVLRKQGYLDALEAEGKTPEEGWIQKGDFTAESGYRAMKSIWESADRKPDAVFAVTDRLAVGALEYLRAIGVKTPEETAVAGIGNSEISKYVTPSLSTVDYNNEEAGMRTAELLLERLNSSGENREKIVMGYRLLIRDSLR